MAMSLINAGFAGFVLGVSLIIAIGAQNAFVLRQGLLRQHVFALCLICSLADASLITLGVAGFGTIVRQAEWLIVFVTLGGVLFLLGYGALAFKRALRPEAMDAAINGTTSLKAAVTTCLALTFLNPHVYLDTVILLGGLSARYEGVGRLAYGLGAVVGSFVWFFALGYGARLLVPVFQKPVSWRVLDTLIGLIMWWLAAALFLAWYGGEL